jgi:2-dehydropantoate 2-reductase
MRFVVYGPGGTGGVVGGRLAQAGHEVVLIARGEHLEVLRAQGLRVDDPEGSALVPVTAVGSPDELEWQAGRDVVLLAMKSQDTVGALDALAAVAPPEMAVACLQNGVANEREALRRFANVYGVCVMAPTTHLEPGVVQAHSSPVSGLLDTGRYPSGCDDVAVEMTEAFSAATFPSVARDDIMRWKYRKLVMNLGNAVEALLGAEAFVSDLARQARREGDAVLDAAGISVASKDEDNERRGALLSVRPIGGEERGGGSSWQSLQRSAGSIESDYLNGEIVLLGRLHGVATPLNELLQRWANRAARERWAPGSVTEADLLADL